MMPNNENALLRATHSNGVVPLLEQTGQIEELFGEWQQKKKVNDSQITH